MTLADVSEGTSDIVLLVGDGVCRPFEYIGGGEEGILRSSSLTVEAMEADKRRRLLPGLF